MWHWLWANRQWVFSGIGVLAVGGLFALMNRVRSSKVERADHVPMATRLAPLRELGIRIGRGTAALVAYLYATRRRAMTLGVVVGMVVSALVANRATLWLLIEFALSDRSEYYLRKASVLYDRRASLQSEEAVALESAAAYRIRVLTDRIASQEQSGQPTVAAKIELSEEKQKYLLGHGSPFPDSVADTTLNTTRQQGSIKTGECMIALVPPPFGGPITALRANVGSEPSLSIRLILQGATFRERCRKGIDPELAPEQAPHVDTNQVKESDVALSLSDVLLGGRLKFVGLFLSPVLNNQLPNGDVVARDFYLANPGRSEEFAVAIPPLHPSELLIGVVIRTTISGLAIGLASQAFSLPGNPTSIYQRLSFSTPNRTRVPGLVTLGCLRRLYDVPVATLGGALDMLGVKVDDTTEVLALMRPQSGMPMLVECT